jgi:hypothetical protein
MLPQEDVGCNNLSNDILLGKYSGWTAEEAGTTHQGGWG